MDRREFIDMVFVIGIGCLIQSSYEDNILIKKIVKLPVSGIYDKSWIFIEELIRKNGITDLQSNDIETIQRISCWNKQLRSYYGDEYLVLERNNNPPIMSNYFIYLELINSQEYWYRHRGRFERWRHKKDWGENI